MKQKATVEETKKKWEAVTYKLPIGYRAKLKRIAGRNPLLGLPQDRNMTRQLIHWIETNDKP